MTNGVRGMGEVAREYRSWATSSQPRIPTGFSLVDSRTGGGIAEGEVLLFLARPQVGKTTWALNVIRNNPDTPSLFVSIEMHGRYLLSRLAAMRHGISTIQLESTARFDDPSSPLLETAAAYDKLAIVDDPAISTDGIREAIDDATELLGTRPLLVMVDYLELIRSNGSSAVEAVDRVAVDLKRVARDADVALVVLHQVGRSEGGNGDVPLGLKAGRYGGEQAADYVVSAFRPCLSPNLTEDEYRAAQPHWYFQFLKNRASGAIHPAGALHWLDPISMVIGEGPPGQQRLEH